MTLSREEQEELLEALDYIDPDLYDTWFTIGCSLKTLDFPLETFLHWSARSPKYDQREAERKWNRDLKDSREPQKEASIIRKYAREAGWKPDPEKGRMDWEDPIDTDWTPPDYGKKAGTAGNGPERPIDAQTGKKVKEPMENEKSAPGSADGQKTDFTALIEKAYGNREKTDYFQRRGLNEATIDGFRLGYKEDQTFYDKKNDTWFTAPGVIIPYPDKNYFVARTVDGKFFYKPNSGIAGPEPLFLAENLKEAFPVFVVESQLDALSIYQKGGLAVAIGGTGKGKLLEAVKADKPAQPLILALDNDETGESMYKTLSEELDALKVPYIKAKWTLEAYPDGKKKDCNDYLQGNPEQLAEDIKRNMKQARKLPLFEESKKDFDNFIESIFEDKYKLIPTGLPALDSLTQGGLLPGSLVIVGGPPGSGKTALCSMVAENMARSGRRFLFLNLEMSQSQLYARSLSRIALTAPEPRTLTALDVLQAYQLPEEDQLAIRRAAAVYRDNIAGSLVYNPSWTSTSAASILGKLQEVAADSLKEGRQPPDLCLDYLQLVSGAGRTDQAEILKEILTGLKQYATTYNAIVIAITAQNRRSNQSEDPIQESGRDSSNLEYSADLLLQMIPEKGQKWEEQGRQFSSVYVCVTKSRFTPASVEKEDGKQFYFYGGQSFLLDMETGSTKEPPEDRRNH